MNKSNEYIENLDKIFNGDKELMYKACKIFIKYFDYYISLMKQAHLENNWHEIKRIAHSFKTSLTMFGEINVIILINRLEGINQKNEREKIFDEFIIAMKKVKKTSQYIIDNMTI